jgi:hypothetical protein
MLAFFVHQILAAARCSGVPQARIQERFRNHFFICRKIYILAMLINQIKTI